MAVFAKTWQLICLCPGPHRARDVRVWGELREVQVLLPPPCPAARLQLSLGVYWMRQLPLQWYYCKQASKVWGRYRECFPGRAWEVWAASSEDALLPAREPLPHNRRKKKVDRYLRSQGGVRVWQAQQGCTREEMWLLRPSAKPCRRTFAW